jgi:hypothetical protein
MSYGARQTDKEKENLRHKARDSAYLIITGPESQHYLLAIAYSDRGGLKERETVRRWSR